MSLTRKQWEEFWTRIEELQKLANTLHGLGMHYRAKRLQTEIDWMKEQIQSVIGRME